MRNLNLIGESFVEWLCQRNRHKFGLRVHDKTSNSIYILAAVEAGKYQWVNTLEGSVWGPSFPNNENPLKKLQTMDWEFILPELASKELKG